jgi:tRNA(Ile)-lysidine synthase
LFLENNFEIAIAHCNFLLRGNDSHSDETFVENFAKANKIPFYSIKFDTKNYAAQHKISIEMAARELRYNWFETLQKQHNYSKIAIAHNLNDVVETFFLNLTRGTGIKGLLGIAAKTETIIRPLLFASRRQIEDYAKRKNIEFCTDITNASNEFSRNRIRNNIIGEFEKINPSFLQTMQENINHLQQAYDTLNTLKNQAFSDIIHSDENNIFINIEKLKQSENPQFWLFEILQNYNFGSQRIADIFAALDGESGKKFFSPTHLVIKDRENLIIAKTKSEENIFTEIGENTSKIEYPLKLKIEKIENKNIAVEKKSNIAFLNFDKLKFPLTLRKWQAGDSFTPFGMKGKKKVSDYLINAKFSQLEKDEQYVLLSDEKIIWLVNCRIDNAFGIDQSCKNILKITVE